MAHNTPRASAQIHYANDSWNDPGGPNLYGNLKQLFLLKQQHRHLKVLLSIGGWTYSLDGRFSRPISTPAGRARFVESAVALVRDYALDGLDIDFEYPKDDAQARDYVALLKGLREGLDALQGELGVRPPHGFELTIAAVRSAPLSFLSLLLGPGPDVASSRRLFVWETRSHAACRAAAVRAEQL